MSAPLYAFRCPAFARALAAAGLLMLAACSGGIAEHGGVPTAAAPAADLDTAKPPPQTVTQTPLLPPVPAAPDQQQSPVLSLFTKAPYVPPAPERLYSADEQARIEAELAAAAAKAQAPVPVPAPQQ